MTVWQNVIIVHGANVRPGALQSGKIPVRVKAASRSTKIAAAEFLRDRFNFRGELVVGIVGNDDFKRLLILRPQTGDGSFQRSRPIPRDQGHAEQNGSERGRVFSTRLDYRSGK